MGNKKFQFLRFLLVFTDFVITNACLGFTLFFLSRWHHKYAMLIILIIINVSWLLSAYIFKLYKFKTIKNVEATYRQTWRTCLVHICCIFVTILFLISLHAAESFIKIYGIFLSGFMLVTRFFHTYLTDKVFKRIHIRTAKKIAILGNDLRAIRLADYFHLNNNLYQLSGFFSDEWEITHKLNNTPVFPLENCINHALTNNIKEIYSTIMPDEHPLVPELIEEAEKNFLRMRFVDPQISTQELSSKYFRVERIGDMPVISLRSEPLVGTMNRFKKRAFDLFISTFAIVFILSWLIPLVSILIKISSKGPVFFVQDRSGKDNQTFRCYKFRSMRVNNDSHDKQAQKNDARITKIGAFLRKTSLDEFPQFLNVFKGDMSIAGPRPHMLKHTEEYSAIIQKYMVRHFLKPGITGWAQVNGFRGETDQTYLMEKRVEHDIWYMENWSLMLDVRIVVLTIFNIFKGEELAR